ncbi:MAG: hypothetical protein QOH90_881, partial [Actinomycetota bacterium]|nr:hypothetical protein [Actinomycetota bacterium]
MNEQLVAATETAEARWLELWIRGPQPRRWTEPFVQAGNAAPHAVIPDAAGKPMPLSELWAERPALILFWRHFGCGCGIDRAARLRAELEDYQNAGANVAIIGQGEPARAAVYAEKYEVGCPLLVDTDESVYEAYGLTEGTVPQLLFDAPESFWSHDREIGESFQNDRRAMDRPLVDNP